MRRGYDFIHDAVSKLESLTQATIELDNKSNEYDGALSINANRLNIIAKAAIRESNVGITLNPSVNQTNEEKSTYIFIAKYISKSSANLLKDSKLNYLDASGNAYIKTDNLFISIEGQKTEKYDKDQSRAFQEAGLKLILLLLSMPESLAYSYRELSEKTGISIGSVSNIFNELEDLKYILVTKQKKLIKNKKELIERWVIAYNEVLKPRILRKRMKFSEDTDFNDIKTLPEIKISAWGGEAAAAILTEKIRPEQYILFSNAELSLLSKQFKLIPNPNGNLEICELFWKFENETLTAPPLVVYADLISSGFERNREMAKIVLEDEL